MVKKATFAQLLGIGTGDPQLQFLGEAGYAWLSLGDPAAAIMVFEGLTFLAPNAAVGFLGWAEALVAQQKLKDAEEKIRAALRCENTDRQTLAYCYFMLGRTLIGLGKAQPAQAAYETACELDAAGPGAVLAKADLAIMSDNMKRLTARTAFSNSSNRQATNCGIAR